MNTSLKELARITARQYDASLQLHNLIKQHADKGEFAQAEQHKLTFLGAIERFAPVLQRDASSWVNLFDFETLMQINTLMIQSVLIAITYGTMNEWSLEVTLEFASDTLGKEFNRLGM